MARQIVCDWCRSVIREPEANQDGLVVYGRTIKTFAGVGDKAPDTGGNLEKTELCDRCARRVESALREIRREVEHEVSEEP